MKDWQLSGVTNQERSDGPIRGEVWSERRKTNGKSSSEIARVTRCDCYLLILFFHLERLKTLVFLSLWFEYSGSYCDGCAGRLSETSFVSEHHLQLILAPKMAILAGNGSK
ncbi:hypothetical protein WG66_002053 [Moniliophthora roreri]|nr:hypothetical protein WG66_002053 [Moniliophthora roreri]